MFCQHRDVDDNNLCDKCGESYTDGTDVPSSPEHVHTFDSWKSYGNTHNYCNEALYFRICSGCSIIEWKSGSESDHNYSTVTTPPTCTNGGYDTKTCSVCGKVVIENETEKIDHSYESDYSYDGSFHWIKCAFCSTIKDKSEHTVDDSGYCTQCGQPLAPTEGILYEISADGTYAEVVGYEGTATQIVIADTYEGLPVTVILDKAFYQNTSITSVIIPDSVIKICYEAFSNCSKLSDVVIGNGVTTIGNRAFYNCDVLTSVAIPDSVTTIGDSAFCSCSNLTSVVIGNGVTTIGDSAFYYCSGLTSVVIPDSVTSIGSEAFYCYNITNIIVDSNNQNYKSIDGNLYSKDGRTLIQYSIGKKDSSFTIPDSVTEIGNYAFYDCDGLTSVVIPNSVTSIGNMAFYFCSGLTSVVIPDSVTTISSSAFSYCNSALYTEYEYGKYIGDASNPYAVLYELTNKNFTTYIIHEDTKHIVPYVYNECARLTNITIPDGVKSIGSYAFSDCYNLTSVIIPDSVTTIGSYAFSWCSGLTSVVIGDSVTSIGSSAFYYCSNLTSIVIPDSVTSIGEGAFSWCSGLTSVVIGDSVTTIGGSFSWCLGLTSVVIGDSVTTIGDYAFNHCSNLTSIVIPDSVTTIGYGAFSSCSGLTSVVIPDSVTTIGNDAFDSCSGLTSVVIPDSITTIGNDAFYGCSNLKDVYITDVAAWCNISFGDYSSNPLYYAKNLYLNGELITEIVIPDSVTTIPAYAFYRHSSITNVVIPDSVTTIGDYAFNNCYNLTSVVIGDSVSMIGYNAFAYCYGLTSVYYNGIAEDWEKISISSNNNHYLTNATRYYYSEAEPTEEGNFWHYDENGEVAIWPEYVAPTYSEGLEYTLNSDNASYSVSGIGECADSDILIPPTHEGLPVTAIGNRAFSECSEIISIIIPDSVTTIGEYAFYYCKGLTSITIPDNVTDIGIRAFYDCSNLTSATIGSGISTIKDLTFAFCAQLTSVTISNGVTEIGYWAFGSCSKLSSVIIPDSVKTIGDYAFDSCTGLTSVYYSGTANDLENISIGSSNAPFTDATHYYYSESEPIESGNFWHYNENGEIAVW